MTSTYRELLRGLAATSDAAFAEYITGLEFPEHLRAAERFADRHGSALVLMPRGHAKTELFVHRTARLIGVTRGRVRIGILTAVEGDAENRSRAVRAIVESPRFAEVFPWARAGVRGTSWTDAQWTVRGQEAFLGKDATCIAMGLRSVRAGPRLDILLADDVVGLQENETEGQREKTERTYWSVVDPMVVPDSPGLREALAAHPGLRLPTASDGSVAGLRWFLGTRWHESDIYASLIRKDWPNLLRQAIADDGTVLWPEVWSREKLEARRRDTGDAIFNLQFQNDPSGMGGNIFKRDWFHYVDTVPQGVRRVGVDLAASASERSDYTAAVECVEDTEGDLYIVGAWRERLEEGHRRWLTGREEDGSLVATGPGTEGPRLLWPTEKLPAGFAGLTDRCPAARPLVAVNIEAVIFQSTFVREILARTGLPATKVYPDHDKVTRARAIAARYQAGKVFHLRGAPGIEEYEMEAVAFPNGRHDDLVDAAVYGADLNGANLFSFGSVRSF
jgi:predicted phage terminase large subunit-like protein